ncbi:MAG: hypothetical protein IJR18_07585 [Campylobacter sp.]|nr:hypothetical protein [Campylobacter sp.]
MKKLVFLISVIAVSASAKCYKQTCVPQLQMGTQQTLQTINQSYADFRSALKRSDEAYKKYNDALAKQNELLEKVKRLKIENAMSEQEILFLIKQGNAVKNLNITQEMEEK